MITRGFRWAVRLSLLAAALLCVAMVLTWISPVEFVWAKYGAFWQLTLEPGRIEASRIDEWRRDEPLILTREANRVVMTDDFTAWSGRYAWCAGYMTYRAMIRTVRNGEPALFDPWGDFPRLDPTPTTTVWLIPSRLLALSLVLPIACLVTWYFRHRRWRPGLCRVCTYDLRGSAARCSECFTRSVADSQARWARPWDRIAVFAWRILFVTVVLAWVCTAALSFMDVRFDYASPDQRIVREVHPSITGWGGSVYLNRAQSPLVGLHVGTMDFPIAGYRHEVLPMQSFQGVRFQDWFNETYTFKLSFFELVVALALLAAMRRFTKLRRRWRRPLGRCDACGYDFRASKDRCPECGTPINSDYGMPA